MTGSTAKEWRTGWNFRSLGESLSEAWVMPLEGREEERERGREDGERCRERRRGWKRKRERERTKSQFGIAPHGLRLPHGCTLVNFAISSQCHHEDHQHFNAGPLVVFHIQRVLQDPCPSQYKCVQFVPGFCSLIQHCANVQLHSLFWDSKKILQQLKLVTYF